MVQHVVLILMIVHQALVKMEVLVLMESIHSHVVVLELVMMV